MRPDAVRFDAADLVKHIEGLSQYQLDTLPFGVILLDRDGTVLFYSQTEAEKSGYGKIPKRMVRDELEARGLLADIAKTG